MKCVCDNCGWSGSAEALEPIQDFDERMGTAGDCAATYGIALMPEGECPECGCLAYFTGHERVWRSLRSFFDRAAQGYDSSGRVPFLGETAGVELFHVVQAVRKEDGRADLSDLPPERPAGPQDGDLLDAAALTPGMASSATLAAGWTGRVFRPREVIAAEMRRRSDGD